MSLNTNFTIQQKRKHGDMADSVLNKLEPYKKRELSPSSSRLRDNLVTMANNTNESGDATDENILESVFDFFETKQKQTSDAEEERQNLSNEVVALKEERQNLSNEVATLEEQLKVSKQETQTIQLQAQSLESQQDDFNFMLEYSDWFQDIFYCIGKGIEPTVRVKDRVIITKEYDQQNAEKKAEAIQKKKAECEANGVQYTGPGQWGEVNASSQAKEDSKWNCIDGKRYITSTDERVDAEKAEISEWRATGGGEDTAPATPFLDRLQMISNEIGVTRPILLTWIKEYGTRNNKCHCKPPLIEHHIKTITKDGVKVKVELEESDPTKGIDWTSFKAAIDLHKDAIAERYAKGKIDEKRRDGYYGVVDMLWKLYSSSSDADGNPILTEFAKAKARKLINKSMRAKEPENPRKRYKAGKWDDIDEQPT